MANQNQSGGSGNQGFGSMDEKRQREIASEGGRAAHEKGTAHEFSSEEAREAGRKGGESRGRMSGGDSSRSGESEESSREDSSETSDDDLDDSAE